MVVMFRPGQAVYVALLLLLASTAANAETGIRLDRLSPKHLKLWEAIRQIIVAEDADGITLHPKLRNLFDQLQTSNHEIYLEFDEIDSKRNCLAGQFLIEQLDPAGLRNVGVIKLYLRNIDHASTDPPPTLKNEFLPLVGLRKLDRYAEVLGHEMAHAVDILFNPERASLVDDFLKKTDQLVERCLHSKKIEPELERELRQRDAFLNELEKPALIAEEQVWQELTKARRK
jgi:hypothetical protein